MNNFVSDFCSANDTNSVKRLLSIFDDIDILYNNGILFDYAISKGNTDILEALLTYFENIQFPEKNEAYEAAKGKLIEFLENATDSTDLSVRMKELLSPYIDFEESVDSREHDFDQFDYINFDEIIDDQEQDLIQTNYESSTLGKSEGITIDSLIF